MRLARQVVPRAVRHAVSAQLARVQAARLERVLAAAASGRQTIVAGPWLGEVGFELLYWVPFLAWFARRFDVAPERLVVVSRGGTAAWYEPFAAGYREIFDHFDQAEFRRRHDERVAVHGEQKQTRLLAFEHDLLVRLAGDIRDRSMLHPSTMYRLFSPYWWGHVDEQWVHRFTCYRRLCAAPPPAVVPRAPYIAVKFYFNDCFPSSARNRAFVRTLLQQLAERGPVVSLTTGLNLDDHGGGDVHALGVTTLPAGIDPRNNLALQSAVVAGSAMFVGTYGGFSYLAPFHGVPSVAFYESPDGFSPRHLALARSALAGIDPRELLHVRQAGDPAAALADIEALGV